MRWLNAISVFALAGCAGASEFLVGGNFAYLKGTPDYDQCAYQAKSNTAPSGSIMQDVVREQELTNMCLKSKGYASR